MKETVSLFLTVFLTVFLGACGTSEGRHNHQGRGDGHNHDHGGLKEPVKIKDASPQFDLHVKKNKAGDWVARLELDGFSISSAGERPDLPDNVYPGHAHLYLDREMVRMVYQKEFTLPPLKPGTHHIAVMLSNPDHRPYVVDGELVRETRKLEIEDHEL